MGRVKRETPEKRVEAGAVAGATGAGDGLGGGLHTVGFVLNGKSVTLEVEAREIFLDTLRNRLGLTGTKKSCDHGQCGACTILADGRRVNACLILTVMFDGAEVTTIEGLAEEELHPTQQAFLRHDAFQCGYCTSGQIMSLVGLLSEPWEMSEEATREAMSGNICRCGAYRNILEAVEEMRRVARDKQVVEETANEVV